MEAAPPAPVTHEEGDQIAVAPVPTTHEENSAPASAPQGSANDASDQEERKAEDVHPNNNNNPQGQTNGDVLEEIKREIVKACDNYRFDEAVRWIARGEEGAHAGAFADALKSDDRLRVLVEHTKGVCQNLDFMGRLFEEKQEWKQESFDHGVRVMYRQVEKNATVSMLVEADLPQMPVYNLCALVYEIELFKNWVPFCEESRTLKHVGLAQKYVYLKLGFPYISHRESYLEGFGVNRMYENGTIVIMCKTIDEGGAYAKSVGVTVPKASKISRFDVNYFFCEITPKGKKGLRLRAISNVNPQLRLIPGWILNFFIRKVGSYMLGKIIALATDIKGTAWEEAMKKPENRPFYEWLETSLNKYFENNVL